MAAVGVVRIEMTPREMRLLAEAADFAGYGCSIAAIDVEPPVDFDELEALRDTLRSAVDRGEPVELDARTLAVAVGLLDYQALNCPPEAWCELDVAQEELNALRERLRARLAA